MEITLLKLHKISVYRPSDFLKYNSLISLSISSLVIDQIEIFTSS